MASSGSLRHPGLVSSLHAEGRFQAWSGQHYLLLVIKAAGAVGAVWWAGSHRGAPRELVVRRGFAAVCLRGLLASITRLPLTGKWNASRWAACP